MINIIKGPKGRQKEGRRSHIVPYSARWLVTQFMNKWNQNHTIQLPSCIIIQLVNPQDDDNGNDLYLPKVLNPGFRSTQKETLKKAVNANRERPRIRIERNQRVRRRRTGRLTVQVSRSISVCIWWRLPPGHLLVYPLIRRSISKMRWETIHKWQLQLPVMQFLVSDHHFAAWKIILTLSSIHWSQIQFLPINRFNKWIDFAVYQEVKLQRTINIKQKWPHNAISKNC